MPRVPLNQEVLTLNANGQTIPVTGGSITITKRSDSTLATLYASETGATIANPTQTNNQGFISAWVDPGQYLIQVSGSGITTYTQSLDATSAAASASGGAGGVLAGTYPNPALAPAIAQSATVNQTGQTVKGAVNIPTTEVLNSAVSGTGYQTMPTPDQVTVTLPQNGLIAVWYQATWSMSIDGAARAAIFLNDGTHGDNQLVQASNVTGGPIVQEGGSSQQLGGIFAPLANSFMGLVAGVSSGAYTGDATTGQVVGYRDAPAGPSGGPCYIFAAAGTYAVSVKFKASSGTVTAKNRKLWVQAMSFA